MFPACRGAVKAVAESRVAEMPVVSRDGDAMD